jgi:hypothetical protein
VPAGFINVLLCQVNEQMNMMQVEFISIEDEEKDLILSFAFKDEILGIKSLILLRTSEFEFMLPNSERGVSVSLDNNEIENDLLTKVKFKLNNVEIFTQSTTYELNLNKVNQDDIDQIFKVLNKMNFDKSFEISNNA